MVYAHTYAVDWTVSDVIEATRDSKYMQSFQDFWSHLAIAHCNHSHD